LADQVFETATPVAPYAVKSVCGVCGTPRAELTDTTYIPGHDVNSNYLYLIASFAVHPCSEKSSASFGIE
jgi:hypothetical protein